MIAFVSALVDGSLWWWAATVCSAAILAQLCVVPARLERQLKSLAE